MASFKEQSRNNDKMRRSQMDSYFSGFKFNGFEERREQRQRNMEEFRTVQDLKKRRKYGNIRKDSIHKTGNRSVMGSIQFEHVNSSLLSIVDQKSRSPQSVSKQTPSSHFETMPTKKPVYTKNAKSLTKRAIFSKKLIKREAKAGYLDEKDPYNYVPIATSNGYEPSIITEEESLSQYNSREIEEAAHNQRKLPNYQ